MIALALLLAAAQPADAAEPASMVPPEMQTDAQPPAPIPEAEGPVQPPMRMSTLLVFGDDPCPTSTPDEIVVCARIPESERYRVPKRLRDARKLPANEPWTNTVRQLEYISRVGTPNSCSPVGSAGQTGCYQQFLRAARDEEAQRRRE